MMRHKKLIIACSIILFLLGLFIGSRFGYYAYHNIISMITEQNAMIYLRIQNEESDCKGYMEKCDDALKDVTSGIELLLTEVDAYLYN